MTLFEENDRRSTTTVCSMESHCMSLSKTCFENCFLPTIDLESLLDYCKLFKSMFVNAPIAQVNILAFLVEQKRYEFNEVIYEQGWRPKEFFLIHSGEFLVKI